LRNSGEKRGREKMRKGKDLLIGESERGRGANRVGATERKGVGRLGGTLEGSRMF